MLIKNLNTVGAAEVNMEGAKNVKVRVIFGPADNAPTFAMRIFELAPAGHTPFHTHGFEHEAVILDGDIVLVTENGEKPVQKGDMVLIMPNEQHQFKNRSATQPARFMCLVPIAYQK
jgi:quercetin dioxygenase-like cupin family protein